MESNTRELGKFYSNYENGRSAYCIWYTYSEKIDVEYWNYEDEIKFSYDNGERYFYADQTFYEINLSSVPEKLLEYIKSPFFDIDLERYSQSK
jgi:hypothetical protein